MEERENSDSEKGDTISTYDVKLSGSQLLNLAAKIVVDNKNKEVNHKPNRKRNPVVSLPRRDSVQSSETDENEGGNCCQLVKSCSVCWIIIIVVFGILAYIIAKASKSSGVESNARTKLERDISDGNLEVCGADNFMMRDGVCDEVTNTKKCHWDGGDCCLDKFVRDETFCKDCSCKWAVDEVELLARFKTYRIEELKDPDRQFDPSHTEKTVLNVESKGVCDTICTQPELNQVVNAWKFNFKTDICTCAWLSSLQCNWETIDPVEGQEDDDVGVTVAYVQMVKTLPCDCQRVHFQLLLEEHDATSILSHGLDLTALSSWHCQQECQGHLHCTSYMWDQADHKCILVAIDKEQSKGEIMSSNSGIVGVADCNTINDYIQPGPNALFVVGGTYDNSCEVFNLERPNVRCYHNDFFDLPVNLSQAVGNVLQSNPTVGIICGGSDEHGNVHTNCYRLGDPIPFAQLSQSRRGAAAVPINGGKALWITGGTRTTDYVDLLTTSNPGFELESSLLFHGMINLNDNAILMIGGYNDDGDGDGYFSPKTWLYNIEDMTWTLTGANLTTGKANFACGKIYDSSPELSSTFYVVAAGGENPYEVYTSTVELLQLVDQDRYTLISALAWKWRSGPSFPHKASGMASATTPDGKTLVVVGGYGYVGMLSDIFQMECWNMNCEWTVFKQRLQVPRKEAVAILLPMADAIATGGDLWCVDLGNCPEYLAHEFVSDGRCDNGLNVLECAYDGGDCCVEESDCSLCGGDECICHETGTAHCTDIKKTCKDLGDGYCDSVSNNIDCNYDHGDCCLDQTDCFWCHGHHCLCHTTMQLHCLDLGNCHATVSHEFVANGFCNGELNIAQCAFDGGDCCLSNGAQYCSYCDDGIQCICHETGERYCELVPGSCLDNPSNIFMANGYCNDEINNGDCNFDGGDCCTTEISMDYCDQCQCHVLPEDIKLCPGHLNHDYIFDGMCDADLNIKECDFDGGDCCLENVDCEYCAAESCLCDETGLLHCNGLHHCPAHLNHDYINDEYCDGDLNVNECNFDGGDCCQGSVNCDYCDGYGCLCHETDYDYCEG